MITLAEMRAAGVRGLLIYCSDYAAIGRDLRCQMRFRNRSATDLVCVNRKRAAISLGKNCKASRLVATEAAAKQNTAISASS